MRCVPVEKQLDLDRQRIEVVGGDAVGLDVVNRQNVGEDQAMQPGERGGRDAVAIEVDGAVRP